MSGMTTAPLSHPLLWIRVVVDHMTTQQRRLALWQAFVTFYLTLTAGASLADLVGIKMAGFLALIGAALNAGTVSYLSLMTPKSAAEEAAEEEWEYEEEEVSDHAS